MFLNNSTIMVLTLSGWWLTYPSEKYEFVNRDDGIPNIWENISHVPVTTDQETLMDYVRVTSFDD